MERASVPISPKLDEYPHGFEELCPQLWCRLIHSDMMWDEDMFGGDNLCTKILCCDIVGFSDLPLLFASPQPDLSQSAAIVTNQEYGRRLRRDH